MKVFIIIMSLVFCVISIGIFQNLSCIRDELMAKKLEIRVKTDNINNHSIVSMEIKNLLQGISQDVGKLRELQSYDTVMRELERVQCGDDIMNMPEHIWDIYVEFLEKGVPMLDRIKKDEGY